MRKLIMTTPSVSLQFLIFLTIILIDLLKSSLAEETEHPGAIIQLFHDFSCTGSTTQRTSQDTHVRSKFKFSLPVVEAGALSFAAAAISSAGGIGGGGLFIPILAIVAGLNLKTASSFSAFMVTGGSVANVICNLVTRSPRFGGKCLVDFDIALLSEPCMLLGVSIGVICNVVFPEWLVTVLFAVFLAWSTFKTCKNGVVHWKMESSQEQWREKEASFTKEPLVAVGVAEECEEKFPWVKLGVLVLVWLSFFVVYLLRGNRYGQGIIPVEPCGPIYWMLSSIQIPLAAAFTSWILLRKQSLRHQASSQQVINEVKKENEERSNRLVFPAMAFLAGLLGGVFGIGGGMLMSPLLLQVGIAPEVTAATCSFMVFSSSTMSAIQYILLGMEHANIALMFSFICFVGSLLGIMVVQRAVNKYGRASVIVFSVSIVMALSTILITSFGAVEVWNDYVSGKYMGFKRPC